jgi:hypothetical protein
MASALFDKGREGFLDGSIDADTDNIQVLLVSSGYVTNTATHVHWSDIGSAYQVAICSGYLATKTVTAGVFDAADITYPAVVGSAITYIVGIKNLTVGTSSRLIFYIDTATGLPVTPNGGDITLQWDAASNKIFKL